MRGQYGEEFVVAGPEILNVSSNTTINWNVTCWATYSLTCGSSSNVTTNYALEQHLTGILASAAAVQSRWNFLGMSPYSRATIYFPQSVTYGKCYNNSGQSWDYDKSCVNNGRSSTLTAHELSHMIHRRKLGYSGNLSDSSCPDRYGWSSPAPSIVFPVDPWGVPNKCATSEGWANFVSAATYWMSYATTPKYGNSSTLNLEGDTAAGNNGQLRRCVRHGSVNGADASERYIGNVTRFFWDLYDTTTIGDWSPTGHTDTISNSLAEIAQIWDWFPNGTANRANDEAGDDGRNVWDYKYWNSYYGLPAVTGLIYVNCLEDQVP